MKRKLLSLLKNKEATNAGWIIGERVVQMVVSLIVGVLSARYLGPTSYGSLNYTASFVTFFTSIATLGMEGVIIKRMIASPEKEGGYLGGCLLLRAISSVLCSLSIVAIVFVLDPGDKTKVVLAFLQSLQLVFQSVFILDSWFQRYYRSKYISIGKFVAYIVVAVYKVILICTASSIEWFAFANSLSSLVIAGLLLLFYRKEKGPRMCPAVHLGTDVLKDSYHYILSGLMVSLYSQIDKIMIGRMMSDADVGLYTTATAICNMWIFVPTAIIQSFRPTIMELWQAGKTELYQRRLRQLYSGIIWLCIAVSTVICLAAPIIIDLLYGKEYMGAVDTLRIAIWFETFSMIGTARGIWILCENKNKYVKHYLSIGTVVNVVLNGALIPVWGIEGAALATLATQITTSLIAPLFFRQTRAHTKIVWEAFILRWYFHDRKRNRNEK